MRSTLKIIGLTGAGEHRYGSSLCLLRALKQIGHEVFTVGAAYSGDTERDKKNVDLLIDDMPYPHAYDYKRIMNLAPWKPDVMFALDPRGAFHGNKPMNVKTCFYGPDPHRAGAAYQRLISEGKYDAVFLGQGAYEPFFYDLAPHVSTVWQAVDPERFPEEAAIEPDCDISFVGHTGIASTAEILKGNKYSGQAPSYDYAERAEFLLRLSSDFSVKVYERVWETPHFSQAIQRGKIGFNRSILNDVSLRVFETMAAGRIIVTDDAPLLLGAFQFFMVPNPYGITYPSLYRPFYENFDVEYRYVKKIIAETLDSKNLPSLGKRAREFALNNHTWTRRAYKVSSVLGGR